MTNFDKAAKATEEMFEQISLEDAIQIDNLKPRDNIPKPWEQFIDEYDIIPKDKLKEFLNKPLLKEEKKMNKIKMEKKHIFVAVYVALIIIELFFYVPYHNIQVFTSNQNVPHTEIIGSGYATMTDITYDNAYVKGMRSSGTGKRVDTQQVLINVSVTTVLAVAVYFLFIKEKNDSEYK